MNPARADLLRHRAVQAASDILRAYAPGPERLIGYVWPPAVYFYARRAARLALAAMGRRKPRDPERYDDMTRPKGATQ